MVRRFVTTRYFGDFETTGVVIATQDGSSLVHWDDGGLDTWIQDGYLRDI